MYLHRALLIAAVLLLPGCQQKLPETSEIEPRRGSFSKAEPASSLLPARDLDPTSLRNMSELIAGLLPESSGGEEPSEIWRRHAAFMDETWSLIDQRLEGMRTFSERELADMATPNALLLYPFGGPDLITAMQLFPEAGSYLLVGLEAPGSLPTPEAFAKTALAPDLARFRRPFASFVESGYFVRSQIDKELSGGQFDGLLPILLTCLVRAGQVPIGVDYVTIDPETLQVVNLPSDARRASAVRIRFLSREDAELLDQEDPETQDGVAQSAVNPRAVYYFAQDLSNDGLLTDDPFSRLIQHQPAINVYIKSGEYLAHTENFSSFRKLVLDKSQTLLQDDSGLPIRFFRSDRWDLRFYGTYTRVLAAYSQWFQDDLAAVFAKPGGAKPLDFTVGYNTTTDGGGLILANRRRAKTAHQADAAASKPGKKGH